MSFNSNSLIMRAHGAIEGTVNVWEYLTTDTLTAVCAPGYFSDGGKRGMLVGDLVWVINQSAPATNPVALCQVTAVGSSSLGGTLVQPTTATVSVASPTIENLAAMPRNLLDGGDFTVNPWQRGTSFNTISNTLTYTADRWFALSGASASVVVAKQAETDVQGFGSALRLQRSSTDTHTSGITVGQVLETIDSIRVQGQPVCLSFWAKAGANFAAGSNGTITAIVASGTGTDDSAANMVSSAWTGAGTVISAAQAISTAPTRYAFAGVVPAAATQLGVMLAYTPAGGTTAGANEWVEFYGVQLEEGGGPTQFEHRDAQIELEIAQRYFYQLNEGTSGVISGTGSAFSASTGQIYIPLPVQMRTIPTVTITVGGFRFTDGAGVGHTISSAGSAATTHQVNSVGIQVTAATTLTAGQGGLLVGQTTNNGKIQVSAEY